MFGVILVHGEITLMFGMILDHGENITLMFEVGLDHGKKDYYDDPRSWRENVILTFAVVPQSYIEKNHHSDRLVPKLERRIIILIG